ncbi:Hypothetical protein HDN1F_34190 [gamma proteobacterium HdN1]|nr:Hypothetical protein HDN1F_34190 [gamma proteobacterium HdN1]
MTKAHKNQIGESTSFREAYRVLQTHAETLRDQREPNIDELLDIVTESVSAYKVCKQRIEAVEAALQAALSSVEEEVVQGGARSTAESAAKKHSKSKPLKPAASPPFEDADDVWYGEIAEEQARKPETPPPFEDDDPPF